MENNLYYTPTLKDLHYDFEFEYKSKNDNWVKVTLDTWNNPSKDNHLKYFTEYDLLRTLNHQDMACKYEDLTCIRVKYLDQSDIESLGWEFEKKHAGLEEICFSTGGPDYLDILYMNYDLDSKYMRISWLGEGDVTRFSGTIKNKSELIKLMQQLNIK